MKPLTILLALTALLAGCADMPHGSNREGGYSHNGGDQNDHRRDKDGEDRQGDRGDRGHENRSGESPGSY